MSIIIYVAVLILVIGALAFPGRRMLVAAVLLLAVAHIVGEVVR